jgi:hypothetical protein
MRSASLVEVVARVIISWCIASALACTRSPLDLPVDPPHSGTGGLMARGQGGSVGTGGVRDGGVDLGVGGVADALGARDAIDAASDLAPDVAGSTDARGDAAGGATDDAMTSGPRTLSLVLRGAPWFATQATMGIAVDDFNRVYVGDDATVFVVDGTSIGTYLAVTDAPNPNGARLGFGDLDIGPDGQLYIVSTAFLVGTSWTVGIVQSSTAHHAQPWADLSAVDQPQKLAAIDGGHVGLVSRDGFWTFTEQGGQVVYDMTRLKDTFGCASQDLAAAPSGIFLYQPGCNAYPILRGQADGSGVGVLYDTVVLQPSSPLPADNFTCVARDPSGGFYMIVDVYVDGSTEPRLYHVAEDAQGTTGLTWIPTVPSFGEAKKTQNDSVFGFDFCSIAVARDGTVFYQTYGQLWRVSP